MSACNDSKPWTEPPNLNEGQCWFKVFDRLWKFLLHLHWMYKEPGNNILKLLSMKEAENPEFPLILFLFFKRLNIFKTKQLLRDIHPLGRSRNNNT